MRPLIVVLLVGSLAMGCHTQKPTRQPAHYAKPLEGWEEYAQGTIQVTSRPVYYRRAGDDFLIPVEQARYAESLLASGIVLSIVQPQDLAGQVVAFHFDFPEPWDLWYKPDMLYSGLVRTGRVGGIFFMCDPGWHAASTDRTSVTPNLQGGANALTPAEAVSRRSP